MHATKPNEVIHFDFLALPKSGRDEYVLVVKDDLSGWAELIPCESVTAEVVCESLVDWFKRFGIVNYWVLDSGAHFKNRVMELVCKLCGSHQHFTTPYCPWANGTVEVVNRVLLRVLRSLLSELQLDITQWHPVLPLVQAALNLMPSARLKGTAPVTAFTGLPAGNALKGFRHPETKAYVKVEDVWKTQNDNVKVLHECLDVLHKDFAHSATVKREMAKVKHRSVELPKFQLGDFVLVGSVMAKPKLALRWTGPEKIVRIISDYVFETQSMVEPYGLSVHHASGLRSFANKQREWTEDLAQHALHAQGGHLVERFITIKTDPDGQWMVLVKWMGLDEVENTWEPALNLYQDVPVLLQRYCETSKDPAARQLWRRVTAAERKRGQ